MKPSSRSSRTAGARSAESRPSVYFGPLIAVSAGSPGRRGTPLTSGYSAAPGPRAMKRCAHFESRKSTKRCAAALFVVDETMPTPAARTRLPGSPSRNQWFRDGQVRRVREEVVEVVVVHETDLDVASADRLNDRRVVRVEAHVVVLEPAQPRPDARLAVQVDRRAEERLERRVRRRDADLALPAGAREPPDGGGQVALLELVRVVDEHARAAARPHPAPAARREAASAPCRRSPAAAGRGGRARRRDRACRAPATSRRPPGCSRLPRRARSRATSTTRSGPRARCRSRA